MRLYFHTTSWGANLPCKSIPVEILCVVLCHIVRTCWTIWQPYLHPPTPSPLILYFRPLRVFGCEERGTGWRRNNSYLLINFIYENVGAFMSWYIIFKWNVSVFIYNCELVFHFELQHVFLNWNKTFTAYFLFFFFKK